MWNDKDSASRILRGSEGTDSQISPVEDYNRQVIPSALKKRKTAEFSARALFALVTLKPRLSGAKV